MINIAKPLLAKTEAQAAYDTIFSGWVTQGPKVQQFEQDFASYVGAKYAIAVSNCTTALHLAMIVAGVGPGDEVICPSFSFIATANAIAYTGATPVFADIDPKTYNIDPNDVVKRITPKTKAILIVHQVGMPSDIAKFKSICRQYHLKLIEDAACAVGSTYKNHLIGSHSDLVCFSFHPRKVITTGDGGMITTSKRSYYQRLQQLRQHGMSVNDRVRHNSSKVIIEQYTEIGYNYRMTDIQASVGIEQLKRLSWLVQERRKIAKKYYNGLKDIPCLHLPFEPAYAKSNFQSFMVYVDQTSPLSRNQIMQKLLDKGIASRRGIMTAHREPAYTQIYGQLSLPISEKMSDNCLILPLYVPMESKDIDYVIKSLHQILS